MALAGDWVVGVELATAVEGAVVGAAQRERVERLERVGIGERVGGAALGEPGQYIGTLVGEQFDCRSAQQRLERLFVCQCRELRVERLAETFDLPPGVSLVDTGCLAQAGLLDAAAEQGDERVEQGFQRIAFGGALAFVDRSCFALAPGGGRKQAGQRRRGQCWIEASEGAHQGQRVDQQHQAVRVAEVGGVSLSTYIDNMRTFDQAFAALREQRYRVAIDLFAQVLRADRNHVQTYGNLGLAYAGLGNRQKALECLDKAIELDPEYEPALVNRLVVESLAEGEALPYGGAREVSYYSEFRGQNRSYLQQLTDDLVAAGKAVPGAENSAK